MSNYELINELRDQAEVIGPGTEYHLLMEAADVIEALDERVAIMSVAEGSAFHDGYNQAMNEANPCRSCQEFSCDGCRFKPEAKWDG